MSSSNNLTTVPKNRPDRGSASAATASSSQQVVGSHGAFRKVDELVAKPTYGSDGARAWQTFRSNAVSDGDGDAKRRIANASSSSRKGSSLGSAPLAPLKKLDRLLQFASWNDEVEHEKSVRLEDGSATLHSGYQLFHEKPQPKKKKSADGGDEDGGDGGAATATATATTKTTTSRKRGGLDDDAATRSAAASEESRKKKAKKPKSSKATAVTVVDTPDHPLQQVAEAIRRRTEAMSATPAAASLAGAGLPPGWEAAVDSTTTQQMYYYNRVTNQRQWTVPDPAAEAASASSSSSTTTRDATETEDSASGLPPGWVSVTDPTTRMAYYYHQETRETRWDRPGAA
jgi:WW domain